MSEIESRTKLFIESFNLAWEELSPTLKAGRSDAALRLRDIIQMAIKAGASDPLSIAANAVRWVRENRRL